MSQAKIDKCFDRVHSSVNTLATQGIETISIMADLANVVGLSSQQQRTLAEAMPHLEAAVAALGVAARALRGKIH